MFNDVPSPFVDAIFAPHPRARERLRHCPSPYNLHKTLKEQGWQFAFKSADSSDPNKIDDIDCTRKTAVLYGTEDLTLGTLGTLGTLAYRTGHLLKNVAQLERAPVAWRWELLIDDVRRVLSSENVPLLDYYVLPPWQDYIALRTLQAWDAHLFGLLCREEVLREFIPSLAQWHGYSLPHDDGYSHADDVNEYLRSTNKGFEKGIERLAINASHFADGVLARERERFSHVKDAIGVLQNDFGLKISTVWVSPDFEEFRDMTVSGWPKSLGGFPFGNKIGEKFFEKIWSCVLSSRPCFKMSNNLMKLIPSVTAMERLYATNMTYGAKLVAYGTETETPGLFGSGGDAQAIPVALQKLLDRVALEEESGHPGTALLLLDDARERGIGHPALEATIFEREARLRACPDMADKRSPMSQANFPACSPG